MGDFNYPAIDWSTLTASGSAEQFLEAIKDSFLYQHASDPTHYRTGNTPSILDLIFTNEEHMVSNLTIGAPVGNSDHATLTFNYHMYHCATDSASVGRPSDRYVYKKGDYNLLSCTMIEDDWDNILENCSLDNMWCLIKNRINDSMDIAITKRVPHLEQDHCGWMQILATRSAWSEGSTGSGKGTSVQG